MTAFSLSLLVLAQAATIAPDAEVRAITTIVLDKEGAPVEGLSGTDVALSENGVIRDITSFRPDTRPLTVAVIVDTSQAVGSALRAHVVDAVSAFIARMPSGTAYALWATGDRPTKLVDYTEDPAEASKALLRVPPLGGNYMLDALAEASKDLKEKAREGTRSAVVAISGTGPELSYLDKWRSADTAEENADLFLMLQVDVGGADFEMRANLSFVFDRLARATGGEYDVILSYMGTDTGLRKLSPFLTAGYRLAYATVPDLKKREIEVTVARPDTEARVPIRTDIESELAPEL
ncbi:MAG: VWA domain-containing protein [Acidobacteriota bacterium]|jgi:VWFA-related protein